MSEINGVSTNQFDWVDFYKELASKLLQYKDNRQELVEKVRKIYETTGINLPTLERDNQIVDIDPFTVFGLFNKRSMKESNRKKIISAVANLFGVNTPVPTSFDSIPVLNNQNATFYRFVGEREDSDIDDLWLLFESALAYAASPTTDNRSMLCKYFDLSINIKGNAIGKITMGMYWIAPNTFLNLDDPNKKYIYESEKIPADLRRTLPTAEPKIQFSKYFDIVKKLQAYLQSDESLLQDFNELNFEAWQYSKEVNKENPAKKVQAERETTGAALADEDVETIDDVEEQEIEYPAYDKEKFLKEVYMDEDSYETLVALVCNKKNVILQGAPGVGKTFAAKRLAYSMMGVKDPKRVMMVQFHQSYSYEDFIMGFRPSETGFELKHGAFYNFCKEAEIDSENKYFFIIDEINRGNLSKIFGELFMLIESDKRGVELQLLYSDEKFSVPSNVYIIGMMNTADRSLAMLDYALRRRFAFYEMKPGFETDGFREYQMSRASKKFDSLINYVEKLNAVIAKDESLGEGFCIGHSYFCNLDEVTDQTLSGIVEFELIPLLKEYWFDEPKKVNDWSNNLRNAIK